jgi:hypothetical protein
MGASYRPWGFDAIGSFNEFIHHLFFDHLYGFRKVIFEEVLTSRLLITDEKPKVLFLSLPAAVPLKHFINLSK